MLKATDYQRKKIEVALAKAGVSSWKGGTVKAYVNHGRWVADCPCNGSELVTPRQPMLCGSCGAEHKVTFPKGWRQIETLLAKRPAGINQNWTLGQTISELEAENIENGIYPDDLEVS